MKLNEHGSNYESDLTLGKHTKRKVTVANLASTLNQRSIEGQKQITIAALQRELSHVQLETYTNINPKDIQENMEGIESSIMNLYPTKKSPEINLAEETEKVMNGYYLNAA